ncbi:MAG: aspartate/glutamate racemase family protein, partial [Sinobacteraceae bacterium]|nr:aspartate/glutamate racemase family protein [Nevskiaceae bacterium]
MEADAPIGVFDSGLGGVSVLRELRLALPHENFIYLADSRHCPYGGREVGLVQRYSQAMAEALLGRGVKLVTVACNTATVNAIDMLRQRYEVPFVGMEPAVKPAADVTRSGVVGVLSTRATADGARVQQLIERYAHGA